MIGEDKETSQISKGLCTKYREVDSRRSLEAVKDRAGVNGSAQSLNNPETTLKEKVSKICHYQMCHLAIQKIT
jgi:hypothetical protein